MIDVTVGVDHGDDRLAPNHEAPQAERGRDAEACRREHIAGSQHHDTSPHVVGSRRDMITRDGRRYLDMGAAVIT